MSAHVGLVSVKCPVSDHLLFQARPEDWPNTHIVIRCRQCKSFILVQGVNSVHQIAPPPGSYHVEFAQTKAKAS